MKRSKLQLTYRNQIGRIMLSAYLQVLQNGKKYDSIEAVEVKCLDLERLDDILLLMIFLESSGHWWIGQVRPDYWLYINIFMNVPKHRCCRIQLWIPILIKFLTFFSSCLKLCKNKYSFPCLLGAHKICLFNFIIFFKQ